MPGSSSFRVVSSVFAVAALMLAACTANDQKPTPSPSTSAPSSSGVTTSPTPSPTPTVPIDVNWSNCNQLGASITGPRTNAMQFTCGKLDVPLDYSKPNGPKTQVFLVRIHPNSQNPRKRIGSLVVNPGGPGVSGVNAAVSLVNSLDDKIFERFDLVGFDPRGVGLSNPLSCISDKQKDQFAALNPDVRTPAGRAQAKAVSIAIVTACTKRYGAALAHYNTEETARDLDRVRAAVGDSKLSYLGYSYGTVLGATYAHLFPNRLRAAVLDGAVDPVTNDLVVTERQVRSFEASFDQFAQWCVKDSNCKTIGDPRTATMSLIKEADRAPLTSSDPHETRKATGGIVTTAVILAMYDQAFWPVLGHAILDAQGGDARGLFQLADQYNERDAETGHYSNVLDTNITINCNDSDVVITDALVAAKAVDWVRKYPLFGETAAASLYSCYGWPRSGHPQAAPTAPTAPKILVIGTVHDPATPYAAAKTLATALGSGVVLTWDGQGHTAYPKTDCITGKVDNYLLTTTIPADDFCPLK